MLLPALLTGIACTANNGDASAETGTSVTDTGGTGSVTVTENEVTLSEVQKRVFTPSCALANCHDAAAPRTPHLVEGQSWSELVGVQSAVIPSATPVVPGEPTNSYLVLKLNGTIGIAGVQMPFGTNMDPTLVTLVEKWILAGALDN